jgi:filamentous hemagglutinin
VNFTVQEGSFVQSPTIVPNTTIRLSAEVPLASGKTIPVGSTVTVDAAMDTMKVILPDGTSYVARYSTSVQKVLPAPVTGRLIGSIDSLTPTEQAFVKEMVAGGKTVEIIPTGAGRTADFFMDGVKYELKSMFNVVNQTSDGLSKALSSTIMNARGQSGNIIIDARGQAGMTAKIAERGVKRAFSRDNDTGSKIQNVTVITPEGTVYIPRLPQ